MATRTTTQMIDDLDGTVGDDVMTVRFAAPILGNGQMTGYEVELTPQNQKKLFDAMQVFIDVARPIPTRPTESVASKARKRTKREGTPAWKIREWAQANDYDLAARGRIPQNIVDAYEEANGGS